MGRLLFRLKERIDDGIAAQPNGWGWLFALGSGLALAFFDMITKGVALHVSELSQVEQLVYHFGLPFIIGGSISRHGKKLRETRARAKAEAEQAASEQKHRALASNIPGMVYRLYLLEGNRMEFFNSDVVRDLTGYKLEELGGPDGGTVDRMLSTEDVELRARARQHTREQEAFEIEYTLTRKDGTTRRVSERGRLVLNESKQAAFIDGVIFDMTERMRMQEDLRAERDFAENLVETAQVIVLVLDTDGSIARFNSYTASMTGHSLDAVRGKNWFELFLPPEERQPARERMAKLLKKGSGPAVITPLITREGEVKEIIWFERPLRDNTGMPVGVLAVGQDITERRLLEEQLRQSEKMQAIGELAGGVAHDFNNQLSGILGYAEMARERVGDGVPKLAKYLDNIITAAQRSADLTAKLLAFARKGKFRTVPVNVNSLIGEVCGILERSIDRRIELHQDLRAHPPVTVGDPTLLQNAILNVSINARDAMPDGGTLTLSSDVCFLDAGFCENSPFDVSTGSYLQVQVHDTGTGMDAQTMRRIFEPFFTTKERGQGTGMGLAAVYGTVKTHHGAIDVQSKLGEGTTISLFLPLCDNAPECDDSGVIVSHAVSSANILFVDDEVPLCDMVSEMLGNLGYQVTVCRNGRDAVEYFRRAWRDIDLVIMDLVMPLMSGSEALGEMRRIDPNVTAVVASGYSMEGEAQQLLEDGARAFVQKPFRRAELSQTIAEVLVGQRAQEGHVEG